MGIDIPEKSLHNISACSQLRCRKNNLCGVTPELACQHEKQRLNIKWTKRGVLITIIGTVATLAVLVLPIYGIFFN